MSTSKRHKNSPSRPTLQDVADLAGVSSAVVSYVINDGPRGTSEEAKARVREAIKELNYHPNANARGLRLKRTKTVGIVVNDFDPMKLFIAQYSAMMLTGLTERLKEKGYYILVIPITIGEDLKNIEALLNSERLDGTVVRLTEHSSLTDQLLERIYEAKIPCVCIEEPPAENFGFSAITYDDLAGAYEAVNYLINQGHRRIGHIRGDLRYASAKRRFEGYYSALKDAGIPYDDALVRGDTWDTSIIEGVVPELLALDNPPTAIFASSDLTAIAVINQLRRYRVQVPQDIAVVGFDDIEMAAQFVPPLTTIHIPLVEIGERAADLILEHIEAENNLKPDRLVFPVELVLRDSV
jgi:LacI family transcriptional regulator